MVAREQTATRSFFRHAATYLSANVVGGAINAASLAILTRLVTADEFGVYSLFTSLVSVATIFLEMNLRGSVGRYYLERADDFVDFLRTCLVFVAFTCVLGAALTVAFMNPIAGFLQLEPVIVYMILAVAIARVPWNLNWKLLVSQQQSMRFARLSTAQKALHAVVVVVATLAWSLWVGGEQAADRVGLRGAETMMVAAVTVVAIGFGLYLAWRLVHESSGGRFNRGHLRYALAFGVPLVPHALSGYVLGFFDRVIVQQIEGSAATGLYSFGYDVGGVMAAVVTSMNQAWLPIFTRLRDDGSLNEIADTSLTYAHRVYAIAMALIMFSPEAALLLGGRVFREALGVIPIVVVGYVLVFLYTLYSNYSFYRRRTVLISVATVAAGAVNIGLNYAFIPVFGYVAAAWTTLASFLALFVAHYSVARWVLREEVVPLLRLLLGLALLCGGAALVMWVEFADLGTPFLRSGVKLAIAAVVGAVYLTRRRKSTS